MKKLSFIFFILIFSVQSFAQFGQNKVQYKSFTWYYIQTTHFDIYFTQQGSKITEFAAKAAEDAINQIQNSLSYRVNNRITLILFNSQNDFQETNVTDEYLGEGIGGFTELFKNRVVLPFTGSYKDFRHVIHHELVHAVMNDMFYGGSLQNIISNNIQTVLPLWLSEGLAEYLSLGWDTNTDMYIRDAATSEYLPDIPQLNGYFAYRGGQAVFQYIARKYGPQKVGEFINAIKSKGSVEEGLRVSLGLNLEELNERWKKDIKKEYWPDIAIRKDPDEFAKRLTDHRKSGGFYNTSPALSPQGDKIAFISNRDFYFDVYLMNATNGKIIKRIVKGNRSPDFEELNILTPGLTWSPDGKKIALAAKRGGYDVIYIIDVEKGKRENLPIKLDGIGTIHWSNDGKYLAFAGHNPAQSDIYIYNLETKEFKNLTNDIFSDKDPSWSPDGTKIIFASDRDDFVNTKNLTPNFYIANHNYSQNDLYYYDLKENQIVRVNNNPFSDESIPIFSPDGKEILFISDMNGINNIYRKKIQLDEKDSVKSIEEIKAIPITNSLNGLYQISTSADGKKLTFSSMYQSAYNIFIMNNPFDTKVIPDSLPPTNYIVELMKNGIPSQNVGTPFVFNRETNEPKIVTQESKEDEENRGGIKYFSGTYISSSQKDTTKTNTENYIFGEDTYIPKGNANEDEKITFKQNVDSSGNYNVHRYKINFSPDIVYANAGYNTLYGLLGTTILSFSDVLGNHRIIAQTSMQVDLKNSDYGIAYIYLPKKVDIGIQAFHMARFVFLNRYGYDNLFRFRNYGAILSLSYPLNRFYRFEGGLSAFTVSQENLDDPTEPFRKVTYVIPAISFVKDNTIFGYTAPIDGNRYRIDLYGNPVVDADKYGFYTVNFDFRNYSRFFYDHSFAFRLSTGFSGGANPQRFMLGGIENWINRHFSNPYDEIPLESPSDFAFLTTVVPMRGYNYAERMGSKYALMNMELRFPLIRALVTGGLPLFFQNILGSAFIDVGSTWNKTDKLQLFSRNEAGNRVTKDLLIGTGFGARIYFIFLMRFDLAWAYNLDHFSKPIFYFSLGTDF